jgi:hypothetical protein
VRRSPACFATPEAEATLEKAIAGCPTTSSMRSAPSATRWLRGQPKILAHHSTGASHGPTEGLNLCVKRVKRCGHGFKRFDHCRLRVLLHAGGVTWPTRPRPPRIRIRFPHIATDQSGVIGVGSS